MTRMGPRSVGSGEAQESLLPSGRRGAARLAAQGMDGRPKFDSVPPMSSTIEELYLPEDIEEVMGPESGPAVIDFWSPTCGPCKSFAPHFAAVAERLKEEEIRFVKVNTQEAPRVAAAFSIRSVPTVLFVHRGEIKDAVVGTMAPDRLLARSQWLLKKAERRGLLSRLFG